MNEKNRATPSDAVVTAIVAFFRCRRRRRRPFYVSLFHFIFYSRISQNRKLHTNENLFSHLIEDEVEEWMKVMEFQFGKRIFFRKKSKLSGESRRRKKRQKEIPRLVSIWIPGSFNTFLGFVLFH